LPTFSTQNITIAQGQSYVFDSQNLTAEGIYFATFQNAAGCDSVVTLNLTVVEPLNYVLNASNNEICLGDEVTLTLTINLEPQYPAGYVHCNGIPTAVVDVTNPATGKTWMDRNLGASQVATSSTDADAYGDLYQWGRRGDGHQCRTSPTTSALSSADQPNHGSFILTTSSPYDWRSPANPNLWQGVNGINNPCPIGYRLPTEAEFDAERLSWNPANDAGAFASPLKLSKAGLRTEEDGSLFAVGFDGLYWSGTTSSDYARYLSFYAGNFGIGSAMETHHRGTGASVRCIKN
jgi:uncharacterized protein (TIGR02145 family)